MAAEGLAVGDGDEELTVVATEREEVEGRIEDSGSPVSGATPPRASLPTEEDPPRSPQEIGQGGGERDEYGDDDDFEREIPNISPSSNDATGSPDVSALQQASQQQGQVWQGQVGGNGRGRDRDAGFSESEEEHTLSVGQVREELRRSEERRQDDGRGEFDQRYHKLVGTMFRAEIDSARALLEAAHQAHSTHPPTLSPAL